LGYPVLVLHVYPASACIAPDPWYPAVSLCRLINLAILQFAADPLSLYPAVSSCIQLYPYVFSCILRCTNSGNSQVEAAIRGCTQNTACLYYTNTQNAKTPTPAQHSRPTPKPGSSIVPHHMTPQHRPSNSPSLCLLLQPPKLRLPFLIVAPYETSNNTSPTTAAGPQRPKPTRRQHYNTKGGVGPVALPRPSPHKL